MKIAYLDCGSGISGDMTLGVLVDAGIPLDRLSAAIDSLGLPDCRLFADTVKRAGFRATQVRVEYTPEHEHRHLRHITAMIDKSRLTESQKRLAGRIFARLAEAEAKVHGTAVENVHFHEVGAADSIADIVGCAVGFDLLEVDRVMASPVPTGTGTITIAHGQCNVPAPATAELLRGVPIAASSVPFELTTPTGAAILTTLASSFGPIPAMTVDRIACGAGQRNLESQPNIVRMFLGTAQEPTSPEQIWVVETNLDDISGEVIGYSQSRLWETGALDVYTTAIQMKKNRPGVLLSVLCRACHVDAIESILLDETTALGVRRWPASRTVLDRRAFAVHTEFGPVEGKISRRAAGLPRFSAEFEACRRIAVERRVPIRLVYEAAQKAFDPNRVEENLDDSAG
jgi:uncharacterized protein (TIGR00299 family) protein